MERRFRSPILAVLLVLTLAAALLPVLSRSAQAAEEPLATTYAKTHYLNENGQLVYGYRPFYSIDDAWEAARKGYPIKLMKDWDTYSYGPLVVPSDEHITVYLNGYTIDRHGSLNYGEAGPMFWVKSDASLAVYGADVTGKRGTIRDSGTSVGYTGEGRGGGVRVDKRAVLIMDNVNVEECGASNNGGGIWAIDGASVTLTNMDFSDCFAHSGTGGAVYAEKASLTMDNCSFKNYCKSREKDGIIALWDCTDVTLSNLTIDASDTYRSYGCVGVWATRSSFTLKDSTISNGHNSGDGDHYGGGLHIVDCLDARVENVTIKDCDSEYGGGIYLDNSKVLLKDVTVDNCSVGAAGYGGGIYAYDHVSLTTDHVTIQNCRASKYGGGIFLTDGSTMDTTGGLTVKNCSAGEEGGGIYPKNGPDTGVTLDGVTIDSCSSDGNGAGIFALNCKLTLNNCDIAYCQANNGGGIYASGNASKTLRLQNGTEVHGCFANGNGGGIYTKGPEIQIEKDSEVRSNDAQQGGGLYFGSSAGGTVDGKVDSNYASKWGGGIYYNTSGAVNLTSNASVQSNVAAMGGGGLCGESGTLNVSTDGIRSNNGAMAGGGIYVGGGTVNVGNYATISDNQSQDGNGGGIFVNSGELYLMDYATLSGNRAKQNGGGLYLNGGTFFMGSHVSFRENSTVNGNGGGICFAGSPDYTLQYADLTGNTAGGNGGAIFYDGGKGSLTLRSVYVTGNHAAGQGGGACINKSDRFTIGSYTTVKDNTCGADKASQNIASNLYLTNGGLISGLESNSDVYVGSDDARSGGFYVATLSGSDKPDLTYLHASDPAFLPAPTGVGRDLWGVVLVKAYSHVKVENGTIISGSEYYESGKVVWVRAAPAPAGKTFDKWVADSNDVVFNNDPDIFNTWFTMPDHDVTVTATYKNLPRYTVTVEGGSTTGGDSYYAGATVTITAPAEKTENGAQYSFKNWTGGNVTFTDPTATTTTFVMPDHDVTVTANYQQDVKYIPDVNLSVTAPEAGSLLGKPTLDGSVSASVSSLSYQWQGTEGTPVGGTATCNSQYLLMVTLKAADGYQFPENVSVTFGGQPALSSTLSGGVLTAYYAFDKTGPDTVTAVTWPADVTIKQGETPFLPDRVSITTKFGTANAAQVTWNPKPEKLTAAGTYEYTPTLVLPEGVIKPDSVTIQPVKVTVKAPDPVGEITIDKTTNENGTVTVTLGCDTEGATIRYSIDGENWDTVNTSYTGSFTLGSELVENGGSDAYVLRVIASKDGFADRKKFTTIGVTVPKPSYSVNITDGTVENGKTAFEQGTLVGIKANVLDGKMFKNWTGSYVGAGTGKKIDLTFGDADAATTTFTMPKGNVTIEANFIDMLSSAALTMDTPTSGETLTLPDKAMYNGSRLPVSWTTQESGDNVNCTATITIPADLAKRVYFAEGSAATINTETASATVSDGSLTVTKSYTLTKPTGPLYSVTLCATIGDSSVPEVLGSYPAGKTVTITAPEVEKYRFVMWMAAVGNSSEQEIHLNSESATTSFTMPGENVSVIALYTPLVKEISFTIPAPEAGKPLAQYPTAMHIEFMDNTPAMDADEDTLKGFRISWNTTDEKAVFGKQYTAIVSAKEGEKGNMTPMADGMTVKVNNGEASASYSGGAGAYYVRTNDAVQVFNVFPATPATMTGLTTPADIHDIKPGDAYSTVGLPDYVEVQTSCGPMAVPVTWQKEGDKTPTTGDYVDLTGTLAYPEALQIPDGTGSTVTQRIYLDGEISVPVKVETPTAVPEGSGTGESAIEYENRVEVTLYCATPGATIHYTTNGTKPDENSAVYTTPIALDRTTTIKAIAVKNEMTDSAVATFTYTVYKTYPVYYSYGGTTYLNGKYKAGDPVTVTATDLPGKTFQRWSAEGIDLGNQAKERTITFSMPEKEVTLTPQYNENSAIITALNFTVERLAIGQALPGTATYTAETSAGVAASGNVNITWSNADGSAVASGTKVENGKTYTAVISLDDSKLSNRIFSGQPRLSVMSPERNTTARAELKSERSATVTFDCTAANPKLKEIIYPAELPGLPNGTTLAQIKEKLVGQVKLVTENGTDDANVVWSLSSGSSYDSTSGAEQSFTLTGTVTIPKSIDQNNVEGTVTVQVTVSARGFVGAPMASVAAGRYSTAQSVELSSMTGGRSTTLPTARSRRRRARATLGPSR